MNDILIIRFSSLGDVVLATAVVEALKQALPNTHLHFLTKREYAGVFDDDSRIDKVIAVTGKESPFDIVRMAGDKQFDAVIDLHDVIRSRAVSAFVRSPRKIRLNKHSLGRRLMIWSHNRYRRRFDVLESYLKLLHKLSVETTAFPCIRPSAKSLRTAQVILDMHSEKGAIPVIGFAPGARHPSKRWNNKSFAAVADEVSRKGYLPVFLGDSADTECIETIRSMMSMTSVSLAGEFDLPVTIGVIALLKGLVTNDTGPMHIAGALGIPFVAVFGPTHPDLGFVPGYPSGTVLHSGVPCSPCSLHGEKPCRMETRYCMEDVTVEMVMKEIEKKFQVPSSKFKD